MWFQLNLELNCFRKDKYYAECLKSCPPGLLSIKKQKHLDYTDLYKQQISTLNKRLGM